MKKVYVACPAFLVTGGTELLHQLVYHLNSFSVFQTFMFYCNYDKETETPVVPLPFLKYVSNEQINLSPDDQPDNMLIIPEVLTSQLPKFPTLTKVIWWLSVDNFFKANEFQPITFRVKRKYFFHRLKGKPLTEFEKIIFNRYHVQFNLYQSEYARLFLKERGMNQVMPLSDYLNDEFFLEKKATKKEDIVAYNPAKGLEFTKALIQYAPRISWVAIQNMTPSQVSDLLARAKVYIDFGYHPGKDRIPREAVLNKCCIITSKDGAANNSIDIPIDGEYKFEKKPQNIQPIVRLIRHIFDDYKKRQAGFANYERIIKGEKAIFLKNLESFLKQSKLI